MLSKFDEQCLAGLGCLCLGDRAVRETLVVQLHLCAANQGQDRVRVSPRIQW